MTPITSRSGLANIARWAAVAIVGALVFGLASWSLALGAKGYFDNYCSGQPDAPEYSGVSGPSYDVLGRTVTCHYLDESQSREVIDVTYRDATPLIWSIGALAIAVGAVALFRILTLRRPQTGTGFKQSIADPPP